MKRLRGALLATATIATGIGIAGPVAAASYTWGGTLNLRAGYGNNPGITQFGNSGTALVGGTLNATLTRATGLGTTSLTGNADIQENFDRYGLIDNYTVDLSHQQKLTERLSVSGNIGYANTLNRPGGYDETTGFYDPSGIDFVSIGRRNERIYGGVNANWQPTERDSFQLGGTFSHASYSGPFASDYDQYGVNFGYLRTISDRTRVGAQFGYVDVKSAGYPDSHSYQASLQLNQQVGATWQLNATAGVLIQENGGISRLQPIPIGKRRTVTPSFSLDLCGNYPRYNVCVSANRTSSPSGFGGLRINTNVGVTGTYRLTERSRVSLAGSFNRSTSQGIIVPRETYFSLQPSYYRDLTQRISVGVSGSYQRRTFSGSPAVNGLPGVRGGTIDGYQLTANVSYRFGRN